MTQIKTTEHNEQAAFIDSVIFQYRHDPTFLRPLFFAVPNGAHLGGNRFGAFVKLKKEGFRNGVSDVLYLQARGSYAYLAIELKLPSRRREKDGGVSEEQREFLKSVLMAGGWPVVCYGADEAIEAFENYMSLPPWRGGG